MTKSEARALNEHRREVLSQVKDLIVRRLNLEIDSDKIDDDSPLFAMGLGLDSIDSLELVVGVEEEFEVQIGDEDLEVFLSVNTLVDYIINKEKKVPPADRFSAEMPAGVADWLEPYTSLRASALMYDARWTILELLEQDSGLEFISWLVAGRDLLLEPNRAIHTVLLDEDGQIIDLIYILGLDDRYWLLLNPENELSKPWIEARAAEKGVAFEDVTATQSIVVVEGPYSWKVIKPIVGFEVTGLSYLRSMSFEWNGVRFIALRTSITNEYGFRIFAPPESAHDLKKAIKAERQEIALFDGSDSASVASALATASAEARFPRYGLTVKPGSDPISNELRWMVDWTKEDFVGKDGVVRLAESVHHGIVGFLVPRDSIIEDAERLVGAKVRIEGEIIGEVSHLSWSPYLGQYLGYADLQREWAYAGSTAYVLSTPAGDIPIETCSTPFFLTESARVQME